MEEPKVKVLQNHRLAYPEAAWIAACGNSFPSRVQWLHKYLLKVDKVSKSSLPTGDSVVPFTTTSIVFKDKTTIGSGETTQGVPIHEQTSLDWVKWAVSRKVWNLLYTKGKINADKGGKELIANEVKDVLNVAVEEGIFIRYDLSEAVITNGDILSIKFSAELEHTILYVDVSGSLYY